MSGIRGDTDSTIFGRGEESYFDEETSEGRRAFDVRLLHEPVTVLSTRSPIIMAESASTSEAMRSMQSQHRGCVLITEDGTSSTALTGIFTERDILLRVINRGRNPAETPLSEVMSRNPETITAAATHIPALRHQLLMLLGEQAYPAVTAPEAQQALREVALAEVNAVIRAELGEEHAFEGLYFSNFVVE